MLSLNFNRTAANSISPTTVKLTVSNVSYDDSQDTIFLTVGLEGHTTSTPTYTVTLGNVSATSSNLTFTNTPNAEFSLIRVGDYIDDFINTSFTKPSDFTQTFNTTLYPGLDFIVANDDIGPFPFVGETLTNTQFASGTICTRVVGNRFYLNKDVPSASSFDNNFDATFVSRLRVTSINPTTKTVTLNRVVGGTGADVADIVFGKRLYIPAVYTLAISHSQNNTDIIGVRGTLYSQTGGSLEGIVGGIQIPQITSESRGTSFGSTFFNGDSFLSNLRINRSNVT